MSALDPFYLLVSAHRVRIYRDVFVGIAFKAHYAPQDHHTLGLGKALSEEAGRPGAEEPDPGTLEDQPPLTPALLLVLLPPALALCLFRGASAIPS